MSSMLNVRVMTPPQSTLQHQTLAPERLTRAKRAFSTRRVNLAQAEQLISGGYKPKAGDLVLARVGRVGQHKRIETPFGRRAHLFSGDEIVVAYGNRYAPDQFEGRVPEDLQPCELVAAGGIAANVVSKHRAISEATRIHPVGVLADSAGHALNLKRFALPRVQAEQADGPTVIAVVGTSMNAGKTTAAARLIRGLRRAGKQVAAAKLTGTGAGGDFWMMQDAGAEPVIDFTDAGLPSTHGVRLDDIEQLTRQLLASLRAESPDVIVAEVADGLLQTETRNLIQSRTFKQQVDGVLFAAGDAMGALAGSQLLSRSGNELLAISGAMTASPLAVQEVEREVSCPVYLKTELSCANVVESMLAKASQKREGKGEKAATV